MTAPHICDPDDDEWEIYLVWIDGALYPIPMQRKHPAPRSAWWERLAAIFARRRR